MSEPSKFVDLALSGEVLDPDVEVDQFIAKWHEADTRLELQEWLGFTKDEYALFVEKPEFLRAILMARRSGVALRDAVQIANDGAVKLAARGVPPEDIPKIRRWLEQTGRL
ncbi:MAG: hypothetical protein IT377_19920 [Polyangiaceae bacterium]|nr:hypothetical protein [Polyangiaceae bacterium]